MRPARQTLSADQFCELLGIDPRRFLGVEIASQWEPTPAGRQRLVRAVTLVLEPTPGDAAPTGETT